MRKDSTQKLGAFDTKSLASLKQEQNAYIPGIVKDKNNYKIPANDFMHKVYHDATLIGDGTPGFPLSVVGSSGGSGSSGSSGSNVFIDSPMNTVIVSESPFKHYHLEGTNWGYRYNINWDDSAPIETLYSVDGNIETEIIHELGDPALKFELYNESDVVTKFYVMTAQDDYYGSEIARFTGGFVYQFNPDAINNYYSLNIETLNLAVEDPYKIDIFSGDIIKGNNPEELMIANDLETCVLDDFVSAYEVK